MHRPLFPLVLRSIAEHDMLLYATFAIGNEQFGNPSNPNFLLAPGELLALLHADESASWHRLAFEDDYVEQPKPAMVRSGFAQSRAAVHRLPLCGSANEFSFYRCRLIHENFICKLFCKW